MTRFKMIGFNLCLLCSASLIARPSDTVSCILSTIEDSVPSEKTNAVVIDSASLKVAAVSPKWSSGHGNPLLDFHFCADPTAVEYNGRLYVYGTNDHQQYDAVGRWGRNTYEHIKMLTMISTDDMVNWTYHGEIHTDSIAPWIVNSWAPSVVKREEADGKTHFYLYFSNSGVGTGVLTATSPIGPWSSPLNKSLVDAQTSGIDCKVPFDPGAVIDDQGKGWLAVGGACARIMRLGEDMVSIDGQPSPIQAAHHFEANELNYWDGTYIYTYNTDWQKRDDWSLDAPVPSTCSMSYMTSRTPLVTESWKYHHHYLKNPGECGFDYSNNHTHLHKYRGHWYIFYHTMTLQHDFLSEGGFRNLCVDEIEIDEKGLDIHMGEMTLEGPAQLQSLNPYEQQEAETTAATQGVLFEESGKVGNTLAYIIDDVGKIKVRGALFNKPPKRFIVTAKGKGTIEVHGLAGDRDLLVATVNINSKELKSVKTKVVLPLTGKADLYFVLKGKTLKFDNWTFK